MGERVLVVGCGGIGGIISAHLATHGEVDELVTLARSPDLAQGVTSRGFVLTGLEEGRTVPGAVHTQVPAGAAPFDWVLLATQPPQVEEAAVAALPHLASDGAVVCFQNGLCEDRVSRIVGRDRVIGGIVTWGAATQEPGVFERTAHGGFILGGVGRTVPEDQLRRLAILLEPVGPVETADDLAGHRWSKLALNCAVSTLGTIGGDRLGPLLTRRHVRRLALELMSEVAVVAAAEGIALRKIAGTMDLDWLALTDAERAGSGSPSLLAKHALLLAVGARYRRMRSSMLRAIEKGRPPAVDFLNGEVVDRAARHGIPVPVNTAAQIAVHRIAAGDLVSGDEALRGLM